MYKSIFLCENEENIKNVYSKEVCDFLVSNAGLSNIVYKLNDVYESKCDFSKIEFIFSTWGIPLLNEKEIKKYFPNLKCVFYAAGSVKHFAQPFFNCGIRVFSANAANAIPVAEFTVAQIILAQKGYYQSVNTLKQSGYNNARKVFENYSGNYNSNIGIIGAGMIGKNVIKMLKDYKFNIFIYDPFLSDEKAKELNCIKIDLCEMFEICTVISNHTPNVPDNQKFINYELLKRMPSNATFINTGRGNQVDEDGLYRFLSERSDVTALLDVTNPEPITPDNPLCELDNCFISPHIAGSCGEESKRMSEYMKDEFSRYISGEQCEYEITEDMIKTMA